MRRSIAVLLVGSMVVSMCACGKKEEPVETTKIAETTEESTEETTKESIKEDETTEAATEAVETTEAVELTGSLEKNSKTEGAALGIKGNMNVFQEYLKIDGNRLYSPYSLKDAFAILYPGTEGESKKEIDSALGFTDDTPDAFDKYAKKANGDGFNTVSKVYINENGSVNNSALNYDDIEEAAFVPELADEVNKYVSDNTNGKIDDLLSPEQINPSLQLMAINAVYFNKNWAFKDEEYVEGDAYIYWEADEQAYEGVSISDEHGRWRDYVKEDGDIDITRLEYEQKHSNDIQYSMYLFTDSFESRNYKVKDYLNSLTDEKLDEITDFDGYENETEYDEVYIRFPKFKYRDHQGLNDMMKNVGVTSPFVNADDFKQIAEGVTVGLVVQSAYIDVNEIGTEAAAATAITMETAAMEAEPKLVKDVVADSPFGFVIKDDTNDVVLFMGYVEELAPIGVEYK